ncbi:hypothetical protein C4544_05155 [candidate division WS5 bacterium]|uniref:Uncharacterized protein n=1 Tax=candidate division WS5 bacterium TaxID=2093353 RepID=A0A419DBB5_9BACT|nr:MAG: hypothetical protein C4544_05155 [candidate division WS5 bacterium]
MIDSHQKLEIPSVGGGHPLQLEINWRGDIEDVVRFTINGQTAVIKRQDLFSFMFMTGTPEQQELMTPVRETKIVKHVRQHRVVAKKDIKVGQQLIVNCEVNVPVAVYEGLKMDFIRGKRSKFAM